MFEVSYLANSWRSLLTETLPYEVPLIFSNEILYAALVRQSSDEAVQKIVDCFRSRSNKYTVPYSYQIFKDEARLTSLGVIHPNQQIWISRFYEVYKQSLLDYCSTAEISLRRPIADMNLYSENPLSVEEELKQGIPHIKPEDGEIDVSRMTSYFSYGKYNLLGKFIDSAEFRGLEKKFRYLRTLDVSKCFFNIYTHSLTWAVKGKEYAKEQADTYSFEARFDKLMQRANYNETNGIVVGPEVSRIFAEIIFQSIDRKIITTMLPKVIDRDFSVRRYVDDFLIFASSEDQLDQITRLIESELEHFKLFVNSDKTLTGERPFVSALTLARSEVASLIAGMDACFDGMADEQDPVGFRKRANQLRRLALSIRLISERHKVSLSSLSGWLLGTLRRLISRSVDAVKRATSDALMLAATEMTSALINIAFYVAALDVRVSTTYSVCQITKIVAELGGDSRIADSFDLLMHAIKEEIEGIITSLRRREKPSDCVELYNFLIIGALFFGEVFLGSESIRNALKEISADRPLTYFAFITAKFCYLRDRVAFRDELSALNTKARSRLESELSLVGTRADTYLLACDYVSSPDVEIGNKRVFVEKMCGGQPSKAAVEEAGKYLGFTDWSGVRIVHMLARRELRPVYSWS